MACFSGPEIVNDGLVFHFDLENGVKSWKGKPTTNLASGRVSSGNGNVPTINVSDILPDGTVGLVKEHSAEFIVDVNRTVSFGQFTLTQGSTYTISFYVKNIDCSGFAMTFFYYNPGAIYMGYGKNYTSDIIQNEWVRIKQTFTVPVLSSGTTVTVWPQIFRDGGYGKFRLTYPQLEEGTITTKFVDGIRLDTASIIDISPAKNTITASNLTYRQDDTPTFDGTDDTLYVGDTNTLNFGTNDLTLESWFKKAGDQDSWRSIFQKGTSGQPGYGMHIYNNRLSASIQATYNQHNTHSETLNPNVWYNCSIVFDRDVGIFSYINGELVGNYPYATGNDGSIDNTTNRIQIGAYNSLWHFYGEISQVKIYNRALTATEVQQNFEATKSRYGI